MSLIRVARVALAAVGVSVLTTAAASGATTTLGPTDLSTGGLSSFSAPWSSTLLNRSSSSGLTAATAPGTITTWRFAGAGAGHVQLFIVQPAPTPNGYRAVAASAVETVGPGLNTFSTALPIAPGQLPVLWLGANTAVYARPDGAWTEYASLATPTVGVTDTYSVGPANQVLYNADEEVADAVGNAPAPPNPVVGSLSAASGSTAGGETLTISGENFSSGSTVAFGDVPATSVTVDRFNQLTVVVPPHAEGAVDVRVTNSSGTSAVVNADAYTFVAPPAPPVSDAPPAVASAPSQTVAPKKPAKKTPKKHKKHHATKKHHAAKKHTAAKHG
jgi:hypothetical protein